MLTDKEIQYAIQISTQLKFKNKFLEFIHSKFSKEEQILLDNFFEKFNKEENLKLTSICFSGEIFTSKNLINKYKKESYVSYRYFRLYELFYSIYSKIKENRYTICFLDQCISTIFYNVCNKNIDFLQCFPITWQEKILNIDNPKKGSNKYKEFLKDKETEEKFTNYIQHLIGLDLIT